MTNIRNSFETQQGAKADQLEELLRKVEAVTEGTVELDQDFASVFASAPPGITRSIDGATRLIETELPGWRWSCGYCKLSNDGSLFVPGSRGFPVSRALVGPDSRTGAEALHLVEHPEWGRVFDQGFFTATGGAALYRSQCWLPFLKQRFP